MVKELRPEARLEDVLQTMECHRTSPNYDEYVRTCRHVMARYGERFRATGWLVKGDAGRADCLVQLDPSLEKEVEAFFAEGEYLEGMMLNTIADYLLFDAVEKMEAAAAKVLEEEGLYLLKRHEPGSGQVPLEAVAQVLEAVRKEHAVAVRLSEGFMMEPVKASAHWYELSRDPQACLKGHACAGCGDASCRYRKVALTVIDRMEERMHLVGTGTNLLDALRRHGYAIEAPCGGKRLCNKCKVEQETAEGPVWIYACKTEIEEPMTIRLQNADRGHVMADYHMEPVARPRKPMPGKVAFAIDIGTTTVVVQCLSMVRHDLLDEERFYNPQRPYGADVISRIQHARESGDGTMTELLRNKLGEAIRRILERQGLDMDAAAEVAIAGNTAMLYFLEGRDPYPLSVSPFTVEDPSRKVLDGSLLGLGSHVKMTLLPVISAYVGGDITAGFYASGFRDLACSALFVDIGTNGEIALIAGGKVLTASTAAGPAFEGAGISCGTGSIDGAVCELDYAESRWLYKTIGDKPPIGLNGSALIALMDICRKEGWVDETGRMEEERIHLDLSDTRLSFTAADVRQLQLAKAAIAAGIRCLMDEAGIEDRALERIYLAGGFGSHVDVSRAAGIGLLPEGAADKVHVLGNSALAGAVRFLLEEQGEAEVDALAGGCGYIELSMHETFNDLYVEEMFFP